MFDDLPRNHFKAADALEIGRAAEHLVVADLILQGVRAFLTDQGQPYDVIADVDGRLIRIQVKSTLKPKNVNSQGRNPRIAYSWNVRRRGKGGAGERLSDFHCDVVALVALDIRRVAYLAVRDCSQTVYMEPDGAAPRSTTNNRSYFGKEMASYSFAQAAKC